MKHKSINIKDIPQLRFSEFKDKWNSKILSDIFSNKIERNKKELNLSVLTNSATQGIVFQRDYFDKDIAVSGNLSNYYIVDVNDFIYNPRISMTAPVGPLKRNKLNKGLMSPLYTVLRPKGENLGFLEKYFETNKWHKYMYKIANYGARYDRMAILQNDFYKMPIPIPSLPEQEKISVFLMHIDGYIESLRKQKDFFELYKKGVTKKIFSPEFHLIENKYFSEWKINKLGDCLKYEQPNKYIVKSVEYDDSYDVPVLTAGKGFILGYTNERDGIYNDLPVIIFDDFTTSSHLVNFPFKIKSSAIKILKANDGFDINFMFAILENIEYKVGNHERHWISKFSRMNIFIPGIDEQKKISKFLTYINESIEIKHQQITSIENWKKGLMQKLFI